METREEEEEAPRPPLPPGSAAKLRSHGVAEKSPGASPRDAEHRPSNGDAGSYAEQLGAIHVVKTGTQISSRSSTAGGADSADGADSTDDFPRKATADSDTGSISSRFPRCSSLAENVLDSASGMRSVGDANGAGPSNPMQQQQQPGLEKSLWEKAEASVPQVPDSNVTERIMKGKAKVDTLVERESSVISLAGRELSAIELVDINLMQAARFVPLSSLRGWARLRRLTMHYIRLHMAFGKLRDMHERWELDPGLLKKMEVLGEGCFAVCYRCQTIDHFGNKRELALKLLNHGSSDQDVDDFIRERDLMRKLRHSTIVQYYASGNIQLDAMHFPEMYLAMECMKGGSVRNMILKQMDSPHRRIYTKRDALRWLTDVAKGLRYLHTRSPCVIHRDLKPENIMLTSTVASQASAKVADFGLHCLVDRAGTDPDDVYQLTGNTGSLMYMSPEVFRLEPYNEKADVFSFAVNFWELFNCSLMIARITNMGTQEEVYNYACGVANGIRPRIPESWPHSLVSLVTECWDPFPGHRPSFIEICDRLEACKEDVENMDGVKTRNGNGGDGSCCCAVQ